MAALLERDLDAAVSDPGPDPRPDPRPDGDAAPAALAVRRIALTRFRNYQSLRLAAEPRPVVLTGPNGAGKTNLLEALSFLAPGRGLRRARIGQVAQRAPGADDAAPVQDWAVAARLDTPTGPVEVGTGREVVPGEDGAPDGERRIVRIDGKPAKSQAALGRAIALGWLTPEMDRLFLDASSGRRRFLDRLVYGFVPDHLSRLSAYERALRERARLLREGGADRSWLVALEQQMAEAGVAIAAARRDLVARLNQAASAGIGPFPRPEAAIAGALEGWLDAAPALQVEDRFRAALEASRPRDADAGGAAEGPHRSDLHVVHAARGVPAAESSTGEQKALLIALVLSTARLQALDRGAAPLLLLDEVVAHLDERRREALFDEVCALGSQAWLTGTDRALFAALEGRAQFMDVAAGRIAPAAAR